MAINRQKKEFSAMYSALNKVYVAIMDENSQAQPAGHEIPLNLATAEIIRLLRFLTTKLRIAEISHHFPKLMEFYQQAEAGCCVENNFFEGLFPGDVHNLIFGQLDTNDQYHPGYLNLQEEKETKQNLAATSNNGYRLFHGEPLVNKLLYAIVTGNQDKAERMIKKYPELLTKEGCVTDYNGNSYRVKPFAIARWLGDVRYMCPMMLRCLPQNEEGERIRLDLVEQEKMVREQGLTYRLKSGEIRVDQKPFDYSELIIALQTYIANYDNWTDDQREAHWCKVVGLAQRNLPVHVVAHYCDPEVPFYPTLDFNKARRPQCLDFYNGLTGKSEFWFAPVSDTQGLGVNFGIVWRPLQERWYSAIYRRAEAARAGEQIYSSDYSDAAKALHDIRELRKAGKNCEDWLMQRLHTPIQKADSSPDPENCTIS